MQKIVVKIGSNVLTKENGQLDTSIIAGIVEQIATLKKEGHTVILVSSGAVAAGKSIYQLRNVEDLTTKRQIYSSIGQVKLMNLYYELFSIHKIICSQVLATKEDFMGGERYKNMKNCFRGLLRDNIIPIVNENDVVSLNELMFTDNDELAGLTAFLIEADRLIILSNVNGLYNGNPEDESSTIIPEIKLKENFRDKVLSSKSSSGRGGMESKYDIGKKASLKGIPVTIAHGKTENVIVDIVADKRIGTTFLTQ